MHPGLLVATSALVPFACLGLLMWLSWLEDTLAEDVKKTERRLVPEPIVAIPVQRAAQVTALPVAGAPEPVAAEAEPQLEPARPQVAVAS